MDRATRLGARARAHRRRVALGVREDFVAASWVDLETIGTAGRWILNVAIGDRGELSHTTGCLRRLGRLPSLGLALALAALAARKSRDRAAGASYRVAC